VRHIIRSLLKSPGFTITAVLVFSLGIGTTTAMFSVIDAVLLRPFPYPKPDRLIQYYLTDNGKENGIDYPDYLDMAAAQHTCESLAFVSSGILDLTGKGEAQRLNTDFVSASMFKVSALPPVVGRVFTAEEELKDGPLVVVLSEKFWRSRFNSDPEIVGRSLILDGLNFQIVGVVAAQVDYWTSCDLYVPITTMARVDDDPWKRDSHIGTGIGRLRDGVSVAEAQAELSVIQAGLSVRYPDTDKGYGIRVVTPLDNLVAGFSQTIWLVSAAAACLLLISCANVANLLFARALDQRREMAVRAALGASRVSLAGQLLLQSAFLSFLGGICGLAVAFWTIGAIKTLVPQDLYYMQYRFQGVTLDCNALFFVLGVTVLTSAIAGCLPALNLSKTNVSSALTAESGRTGTLGAQRQRAQSILIIGQISVTCVLLVGTGLLARSLQAAQDVPLGFSPTNILTVELALTSTNYRGNDAAMNAFWDALLQKARRLPGVTEAVISDYPPFYWDFVYWASSFNVIGEPEPAPGHRPKLDGHTISPGYFKALGVTLLRGRDFNAQDTLTSAPVVIVNESLAQNFFRNDDPLGKQIRIDDSTGHSRSYTVIGVAVDVRYNAPDLQPAPFHAYLASGQQTNNNFGVLIVRCTGDPLASISSIRAMIASIDPDVPIVRIGSLSDRMQKKFGIRRLGVLMVSFFSGATLLLSAIGLYALLAYTIGKRRREIGIRIAVGAHSTNILQLVILHGLKLAIVGLIIGVVAALGLTRLMSSVLYGVSATDPVSLLVAILVLGVAALLACLLPALRATRINPIAALRE
jgi:putative ABC transport system permease protein